MSKPFGRNPDLIECIENHRSVRNFTNEKISDDDLRRILSATQSASSSSHGQAYSIINVASMEKRLKIAEYAGNQVHVAECSHFFIYCADLYRVDSIAQQSGVKGVDMQTSMDSTEMFIVATVDAALAAQTTAIAAEALGYGIVYTGGIRNKIEEVSKLLKLPQRVYPVFGMCIGVPDQAAIPDKKPRLPLEAMFFEDEYPPFEAVYEYIKQYDQTMKEHYEARTTGKRINTTWSEVMVEKRSKPRRLNIKSYLTNQGFPLK